MRLTLNKVTMALLVLAATSNFAFAKEYKGEFKGEEAAPCVVPCMLHDGFYVGAQVGYDSYRVRHKFHAGAFSFDPQISVNGWVGGLFVGYGQYLNDIFYVGAEAFGNYSDATSRHSAISTFGRNNHEVRARGTWGLSVLPGVRVNDGTLAYVRLGYEWTSVRATDNGFSPVLGTFNFHRTNTASGFNYGVGLETLVFENWSIRTEFNHTSYNSFNSNIVRLNPSDNQFMVAGIYHIC